MSDIEPWIESAPADVVECLRAARRERPRDEVIERCAVLVAAGAAGAAGLTAAGVASGAPLAGSSGLVGTSSGASVLGLLKWGAGGLLAGTVVVTGAHVAELGTRPSVGNAPAIVASVSPTAESPRTLAPTPPSPTPAVAPTTQPAPTAIVSNPPAKARSDGALPSPSPDARFAEELALINRVRASVDAQNPTLAAALLAEHERRFGKTAQLSPEARYLRLEVLVATGRVGEARELAREILTRDATGPHAARARAVLEKE